MRRATIGPVFAVLVATAGVPAFAAPFAQDDAPARVTITQFDQFLASADTHSDKNLAKKLAGFSLTERATSARLAQWQQRFNGKRTRAVLTALADFSAFQSLPPAELPSDPPPDLATQREVFSRMVDYVATTRPRLPNFSARRNTTRFELSTSAEMSTEEQPLLLFGLRKEQINFQPLGRIRPGPDGGQWLYVAAMSSTLVTYRYGHEVSVSGDTHTMPTLESHLSTEGEFGPILSVVVGDASHGNVTWSHWERNADKTLAVFRYSVPEGASHYAVETSPVDASFPAYTGEIAVDLASGTIYRLTLLAKEVDAQISETGIVVEYGPMDIGGKTYTCPIRSIAISRGPVRDHSAAAISEAAAIPEAKANPEAPAIPESSPRTYLNDVSFTEYHVFRGEARILPDAGTP